MGSLAFGSDSACFLIQSFSFIFSVSQTAAALSDAKSSFKIQSYHLFSARFQRKVTVIPISHQPCPCPASFKQASNALISSTQITFFSTMSPDEWRSTTKKTAKNSVKNVIPSLMFSTTQFSRCELFRIKTLTAEESERSRRCCKTSS